MIGAAKLQRATPVREHADSESGEQIPCLQHGGGWQKAVYPVDFLPRLLAERCLNIAAHVSKSLTRKHYLGILAKADTQLASAKDIHKACTRLVSTIVPTNYVL